jgi:hypothetical protein
MKKTAGILILAAAAAAYGQRIGVSLGSALFNPSTVINMEGTSPPKNICGHVVVRLSDDVALGLSAGYGFEKSTFLIKDRNPGEEYEKNTKLNGVPLEFEIRASKPLVILSGIRPWIGLGVGYYDYTSSGDIRSGETGTDFENRIKGLAQYFSLGLDFHLGRTVSAFLQMKKMGFSAIEASGDYFSLIPYGKFRQPVKSEGGLSDLSLSMGILFDLHPGEQSSFLDKIGRLRGDD